LIFLSWIFAIPLAYLGVLIWLLIKRDSRGLALSLIFFAATLFAGAWAITQSRASTAGIGFLFLPLTGAVAGFFGLAFGRWRNSDESARRVIALLGLAGAIALLVLNIVQGAQTIGKNKTRDNEQVRYSAAIALNREDIESAIRANPGRQRVWIDSAIRANMNDPAFLIAALPNDSVSPEVLDAVARTHELNVTLEAIRNPNTRAETLSWVYQNASYPFYFFQTLAAHHNTPPDIMRKLYTQNTIGGLDIWFAGNPSTPKEILADIAGKTTDRNVVRALLENTAIDCSAMSALATNLMKKQNRTADNVDVQRFSEVYPTVCKGASEH
jgi:hypothetical protein